MSLYHTADCGHSVEIGYSCDQCQQEAIRAAWKAILKWVRVDRLPKDHPLRQMQRALRKRRKR